MTAFTNEQAFGELWYTMQAIKLVTGLTPTCWRPPLGDVDDRIRYIAQQLGLATIMWKYDSFDWKANDPAVVPPVTPADVQANYDNLISAAASGTFNTVRVWYRIRVLSVEADFFSSPSRLARSCSRMKSTITRCRRRWTTMRNWRPRLKCVVSSFHFPLQRTSD